MPTKEYYQRNKEAIRANESARRKGNRAAVREYERRDRENNPDAYLARKRKSVTKWRLSNSDKRGAHRAVSSAIKAGVLPKISTLLCAGPGCSAVANSYHHWSYEECNLLSVIPLCDMCHGGLHAGWWFFDDPLSHVVPLLQLSFGF